MKTLEKRIQQTLTAEIKCCFRSR